MISKLELCHVLETAFTPLDCKCTITSEQTLSVQLINPRTGEVDLTVGDIKTAPLTSSRAIAALVAEIREQYQRQPVALPERRRYRR